MPYWQYCNQDVRKTGLGPYWQNKNTVTREQLAQALFTMSCRQCCHYETQETYLMHYWRNPVRNALSARPQLNAVAFSGEVQLYNKIQTKSNEKSLVQKLDLLSQSSY